MFTFTLCELENSLFWQSLDNTALTPCISLNRLPETSGLALEEIDEMYTLHIKPWKSSSWIPPSRIEAARRDGTLNEKDEVVHSELLTRKVGGGAGMAH